ncbi:hypothetical protein Acor_19530 [Acrocarpospora corrugata]|uniref:Superoxide dismutase [Cu-Zn] n=1 Tax=Acrocarpospora corrugata TaxID=35763 RepID=A0A5M3VVD3_9ACTN|nr:superoxide dismutase family protein [Acrocarpospora corrugata]GER99889.1 hypothetical protein Acor_19530 [Acrocarpospora corrugata]
MTQRVMNTALAATIGIGLAVAGVATIAEASQHDKPVRAAIRDAKGARLGTLTVKSRDHGRSLVTVHVRNLAPGYHGFHVHTVGKCEPKAIDPATKLASPFFTAGAHLDLAPGGHNHADHSGDLPPLLVGKDGKGTASFSTDRFRVAQLTDADGSAIIVHGLRDNLAYIPERYAPNGPDEVTLKTGDAGPRIGCGVIQKINAAKGAKGPK